MEKRYADWIPMTEERLTAKAKVRQAPAYRSHPALISHCLIALVLLVGLSIGLVARYTAIIEKGYELSHLKQELSALQNENKRLQLSVGQLESLDRIEATAVGKLGMVKAGAVRVVALENNAVRAATGGSGAVSLTAFGADQASQPLSGKIAAMFSALYQKVTFKISQAEISSQP